jgi:tRNA nucleotidyltransferase (CCA-adding enzyme)
MSQLRDEAEIIVKKLESQNYEVLYVGGCVRHEELGLSVDDYDITTSASVEEIILTFQNETLNKDGEVYGVIKVNGFEIATFRKEEYQVIGKPIITPASSFYEDTLRRDFTVNAMGKKLDGTIIDYHGGMEDLNNKVIRVIGKPLIRFKEDPSRLIRLIYLASKHGFSIEEEAEEVAKACGQLLVTVPKERIAIYLEKVIKFNCLSEFMVWLRKMEWVPYVLPDLAHTVGLPQNPIYHNSDVYDHIVRVIRSIEINIPDEDPHKTVMLLTGLYHDVDKGKEGIRGMSPTGQINDLGHEEAGVETTREALSQFGFDKNMIEDVCFLVKYHGIKLDATPKWSRVIRQVRRFVPFFTNIAELKVGVNYLFQFMHSDADGFEPSFGMKVQHDKEMARQMFNDVLDQVVFYRANLMINGNHLLAMGITGKQIGEVLDYLVIENLQSFQEIRHRLVKKGWIQDIQ